MYDIMGRIISLSANVRVCTLPYSEYSSHFRMCMSLLLLFLQESMLDKFAQRNPSCVAYDEKLHFYTSVAAEISAQPLKKHLGFAVLHLNPLATALQEKSRSWVTSLGKLLNNVAHENLIKISEEIQVRLCTCDLKVYIIHVCVHYSSAIVQ